MKTIIIEDEVSCQAHLKYILATKFPDTEIVAVTGSIPEAVRLIGRYAPSLVFLDAELRSGGSLDILEQVQERCFELIFTATQTTFAVEAFRYRAIDYLLKPLNEARVIEAVQRCRQKTGRSFPQAEHPVTFPQHTGPSCHQRSKLIIPTIDGLEFAEVQDIIFLEAKGNYTDVWRSNNHKITTCRKIGELIGALPGNLFFRIHHSYIVNIQYIQKYYRGRGGYLILTNHISLPVSNTRKEAFLDWLQ